MRSRIRRALTFSSLMVLLSAAHSRADQDVLAQLPGGDALADDLRKIKSDRPRINDAPYAYCEDGFAESVQRGYDGSVGAVVSRVPGQGVQIGTAFRVSKRLLLTNAHMVSTGKGAFNKVLDEIRFIPQRTVAESELWTVPALRVKVVGNGRWGSLKEDWAILELLEPESADEKKLLDKATGGPPMPLRLWTDKDQAKSAQVFLTGYPGECRNSGVYSLVTLVGTLLPDTSRFTYFERLSLWMKSVQGLAKIRGGSGGNSGGPVLLLDPAGKPSAIGIVSAGDFRADGNVGFFVYSSTFWDELNALIARER